VSRLEHLPAAGGISSNARVRRRRIRRDVGPRREHAHGYRGQLGYPDRLRLVCWQCLRAGWDGVPTRNQRAYGGDVEPVCDAHATPGRSFGREIEPERLQQMVLSAYAVDLLPLEALHRAGFRSVPVPPSRLVPAARAELRQLRRRWSGVGALASLLAGLLFVRALALFPSTGPGERSDSVGVAAPIAVTSRSPAKGRTSRRLGKHASSSRRTGRPHP
jgi:hypothetical protein